MHANIDIKKMLEQFDSQRQDSARSYGHMTLGKLIDALAAANPAAPVVVDDGHGLSGNFFSYRGYYCDLAIEMCPAENTVAVAEFLPKLRECVGKTFEGYKGGDFVMTPATLLWLESSRSDSSSLSVRGVDVVDARAVIRTSVGARR